MKNSKGFTLIELLICIVVFGLIAAMVVTLVTSGQDRAEKPCFEYGDEYLENVPARCHKYFKGEN